MTSLSNVYPMKIKMQRVILQAEAEINFINSDSGSPDYQVAENFTKQGAKVVVTSSLEL